MKYQVDTPSSLSSHYTVSSDDFPYTEWFNMKSTSSYFKKYIVLVIYMSAKMHITSMIIRAVFRNYLLFGI